jgi:hypothetical protein
MMPELQELCSLVERRNDTYRPPSFTLPPVERNWRLFRPTELDFKRRNRVVTAFGISLGVTGAIVSAIGLMLYLVNPPAL